MAPPTPTSDACRLRFGPSRFAKPRIPSPPPLLSITGQLSGGPPSVSCAGGGGPVSPTLPSQPGGRPTGKLRLTWPFSMARPACHMLLRHRGTLSKAPQRRGHSVAPKGWRKGSRSSGNPDPHWQNGTKPRNQSVETEMKLCPASRGTGRWAVAVTPPAVSAQLQPRRPSLQQHPSPLPNQLPFPSWRHLWTCARTVLRSDL